MTQIIQPNLGLRQKSDSQLVEYVLDKIVRIPAIFPTTDPSIADVSAALSDFQTKLQKSVQGSTADTAAKNASRTALSIIVTNLSADCILQSNGDLPLYLSTGFAAKRKPTPSGLLPAPQNLRLLANTNEGELNARFDNVKRSHGYLIYMGEDPAHPETWTLAGSSSGSRYLVNNLTSGKKYYARVRAIGSRQTLGAWSDITGKVCP